MVYPAILPKLLLVAALFAGAPPPSFAAKTSSGCAAGYAGLKKKYSVQLTGDFDPREAWRQGGLDPDKIKVRVGFVKGSRTQGTESVYSFVVEYKGKRIGEMNIWNTGPMVWQTDNSRINAEFRGRGVGSLMYLIAAAKVFSERSRGKIMTAGHSGDANRMWQNLHAKNYAKVIDWADDTPVTLEMKRASFEPKLLNYARKLKIEARDVTE